jgi:hypothetical protein
MLGSLFCCLLLCFPPFDLAKKGADSLLEPNNQELQEYFGSLDVNEDGDLCFYHFPNGNVKPAILYMHQLSFEKRSDKLKAYKSIGKNVKIIGTIIKIKDLEIILVNNLEILKLEV